MRRTRGRVEAFLSSGAVRIFLWSRLALWAGALLAFFTIDPNRGPYAARLDVPRLTHDLGAVTDVWARWDSVPYLAIAEHGYGGAKGSPAFYPLYPWLVGAFGRVLDRHFVLAGVLVSLAASLTAFALLRRLAADKLGPDGGNLAVVYLAVFPMALFLQAVYAESLFLCLALASFVAAERARWLPAGVLAGLACLTRPAGVALVPALALMAWRSNERLRASTSLLAVPIVFIAFPVALDIRLGSPWGFLHAERFWHRSVSHFGPLEGLWRGARAAWAGVLQLTVGSDQHWYWTPVNPARAAVLNIEYLLYAVVFCWLAYIAWRRFGATYGLYAATTIALPLSAPSDTYPLLSMPRLMLTVFPAFMALAAVANGERARFAVLGVSGALLGVSLAQWATWQWVS
jgi:Dolichyl-phosphate-mannose-protein mannosyltransferase